MYYIITSYQQDHWDEVKTNRFHYFLDEINQHYYYCINHTPTIFLRINKDTQYIVKAWLGKIFNLKVSNGVHFSIQINSEIKLNSEFIRREYGWFIVFSDLDFKRLKLIEDNRKI